MTKGEIFAGMQTKHPIVFLREENSEQFIGCIITKAKTETYQNNIALMREHFEENDEKGNKFQIQFINSHFVKLKLMGYALKRTSIFSWIYRSIAYTLFPCQPISNIQPICILDIQSLVPIAF